MNFFTYKLFNGKQPFPMGSSKPKGVKNILTLEDGTMVGFSKDSIESTFGIEERVDNQITSITPEEVKALADKVCNESEIDVVKGDIKDKNPPYIEYRGKDYVRKLEKIVVKTNPDAIKPEKTRAEK